MRRALHVLGLAALLGIMATSAHAGAVNWSGIYGGGAIGYASATTETSLDVAGFNDVLTVDGFGGEGFAFTGVAGADAQIGNVVLGGWGSWTADALETTINAQVPGLISGDLVTTEIEQRWAIGGRAGYLVTDRTLLYALVGYTQAKMSDLKIPPLAASFATPDLTGIVYGGGIEIQLERGLFLRAQYTYSDFDRESIELAPGIGLDIAPHVQEASVGITYKFDAFGAR